MLLRAAVEFWLRLIIRRSESEVGWCSPISFYAPLIIFSSPFMFPVLAYFFPSRSLSRILSRSSLVSFSF